MLHPTRALLFCVILALAVGCGGDDEDIAGPGGEETLSGVAFSADRGVPLARVGVVGLEGEAWDYQIEVVDPDGGIRSGAPIFEREDGTFEFPVPFHPDDPVGGGAVQLRVAKGAARSSLFGFTIESLPVATEGLSVFVQAFRENLQLRAALAGTTVEALGAAAWEDLDPWHVPLKTAWALLDDPQNDNRLSELAQGRTPLLGEGTLDVDLLDRVVDLLDLPGYLEDENQVLSNFGSPPFKRDFVDIGSAEQLDWYMSIARSSASRLEDGSAVSQVNEDLGMAMTALGLIPHPAAQLTSAGVGAVQFAYNTARQAMANLLPSEFERMEFQLSHEFFNEDSEDTGQWSAVDIWARSEGWQADEAVVDGLLALAALGRAHGDWMNRFESVTGTAWATNVRNLILDTTLKLLNAIGQDNVLEYPPQTFGPVDVTGMPWTQGFVLTDKIRIIADLNYQPNEIGTDQLEVRTATGKFGGAYFELSKPVEVRRITVQVTPSVSELEDAGEVVTLQATVLNADDKGLEWDIGPATWEIEPDGVGTGTEVASIRTPANPELYGFVVSVRSTSNTGLRASSGEPRAGSGEIRLQRRGILLDPVYECVGNSETISFTAEVVGLTNQAVTWQIWSGYGTIDANGLYRAPNLGTGEATVVATSVEDPEVRGWATASFGACQCWWLADVLGASGWSCGGDGAGFIRTEFPEEEFANLTFLFPNPADPDGAEKPGSLAFSINYAGPGSYPFTGDIGVYRISGSFFDGSQGYVASQVDEDPQDPGPVLTMTITQHTDSRIVGTVTGQMMREDENQNRFFVVVSAEFSAGPALSPSSCYE